MSRPLVSVFNRRFGRLAIGHQESVLVFVYIHVLRNY
jgi:hypothetical protein